jgi:hypothetical protein
MRLRVVLDSDGLIKLAKADALETLVKAWNCIVPQAVYSETVERGVRAAHPDAAVIRDVLSIPMVRPHVHHSRAARLLGQKRRLGRGEQEALHLYFAMRADGIITDAAAFVGLLERADLPYLPPPLVLVQLASQAQLELHAAVQALERMRPFVRREVYHAARADLEALRARRK